MKAKGIILFCETMIGILDIAKPQIFDSYLFDLRLVQIIFLTRKRQNVMQEVLKKTFVSRSQGDGSLVGWARGVLQLIVK